MHIADGVKGISLLKQQLW